ncbi:MAG: transaldolase family protein [Brevinema sp.]
MDKLLQMVKETPTRYWNDSCHLDELDYAIQRGATGATTNPAIATTVLGQDLKRYESFIKDTIASQKTATEDEIAWLTIEYMALLAAKKLEPIFDPSKGEGRISIQTNTKFFRSTERLVEQAVHFHGLAPNIQVKMPITKAGVPAFEEATYRGVSINATVSFSVPQAVAAAEAVERGLQRRTKEGLSNQGINPVITIMTGRIDDWLKIAVPRKNTLIDPLAYELAGVAVVRHAYEIFKKKGLTCKVLGAAYRNMYHVSELMGGDMLHTIPQKWQVYYNSCPMKIENTMEKPIPDYIMEQLLGQEEFVKSYSETGLSLDQFDTYGATLRTLKQFSEGYDDLLKIIRKFMIIDA